MTRTDFAIFGGSPLAALVAGLLARDHGRSVVRIAQRRSAQRLARSLDLALPLSARPQSWRMVRAGEAEIRKVAADAGLSTTWTEPVTAVLADTDRTRALLDHAAHLAAGFGHRVGRLPEGWAFRRMPLLRTDGIEDPFAPWLDRIGVKTLDEGPVEADAQVLADDDAIIDFLRADDLPPELAIQPMTATLIAAPRPLPQPVRLFPDRGVGQLQQTGNTVLALVTGGSAVEARLASTLPGPFPAKRLATTRFRSLTSTDGAPVIGTLHGRTVLAGMGGAGVFLAPAIARRLAGKSEGVEGDWLDAHAPSSQRDRVADFVARVDA